MADPDITQDTLKELRRNVLSLEMEISPAIIISLGQQVQECWQQWKDNVPALMVLQGMDAVISHVRSLEARSHAGALAQLNTLLQALETTLHGAMEQGRDDAVAALDGVLKWQHACLLATTATDNASDSASVSQGSASLNTHDTISAVISEELKQTTQLIRDEVTAICDAQIRPHHPLAEGTQISAFIEEQVGALHSAFQDELNQLRVELQGS